MTELPLLPEIPLTGGRHAANVVRVGDTVRRPPMPNSRFVGQLLRHFEGVGFTGVPRYLGRDAQGRETLSYIPGAVLDHWHYYPDNVIKEVGAWLRAFHDATRSCALLNGKSVICHNDVAPNNAIRGNGMSLAFIDFDFAAPGEPLEDLGYTAWSWCVSSKQSRQPVEIQAAQVRLLADAYGLETAERPRMVSAITERQTCNVHWWLDKKALPHRDGVQVTTPEKIDEIVEWSKRECAFVEAQRSAFLKALT